METTVAPPGFPGSPPPDDVDDSRPPGFPGPPPPDDADDSRPPGFPDPQPRVQGDGDVAAARRRGELMWELQLEHIRKDMILHQLAETERAMALLCGPPGHWPLPALPQAQDFWHHRKPLSLPPWDEAALRLLRTSMTKHPSRSCGSPAAARPPPVYPHVEWSPSPPPGDDSDQQLECRPPGAAASPMLSGDLGGCLSPSKQTLSDEALVPAVVNAGAGTTMSLAEKVTPAEQQVADGEEPKPDMEDGHGVQSVSGSGNQSSEQREPAESTLKDQTNELVAPPCQYELPSQENGSSDDQKKIAFSETSLMHVFRLLSKPNLPEVALVPVAANDGAETTMSVSFAEDATSGDQWAIGGEPKLGVKDGHDMQMLYGSGNQSSNPWETMKVQTGDQAMAWPYQYMPTLEENGASDEWNRYVFGEPAAQAEWLMRKKQKLPLLKWACDVCHKRISPADVANHLAGKKHLSKLRRMNDTLRAVNTPAVAAATAVTRAWHTTVMAAGTRHGSVYRNPAGSRKCRVCDTRYYESRTFHVGSSRHRQNVEALLAKSSSYVTENCCQDDGPMRSVYHCKACDAQCTGEPVLLSHLVGRKHGRNTSHGSQKCDAAMLGP